MAASMTKEPIRDLGDIKSIKQLLKSRPRDHLLFVMGINSGIRLGDLLQLKVAHVEGCKVGDSIEIRESKTGKQNFLIINKEIGRSLAVYMGHGKRCSDDYLFGSRKSGNPLALATVNRMVQAWTKAINLKGNYGGRTLRKTFGYVQRVHYGVGFEILCRRYNHSNPAVTMRYIGVQPIEVSEIMMHDI
ncbi:tyrosine-type recombinase/integrase [Pseudodesulfovibrio sp.]|uniref:tyrosine-type recombinase/integrase n=1 Tax=Pseudodesulfovibrio sp. TaxID=2035812 RepID=UPI0026069971|nr:tyrosine-type recombinase/integrase [Pseudodesulfovibrio sp.]MDD3311206.1 tyrosine-type recombinase/integrase [Pseudodesulfovibrio sp.]